MSVLACNYCGNTRHIIRENRYISIFLERLGGGEASKCGGRQVLRTLIDLPPGFDVQAGSIQKL